MYYYFSSNFPAVIKLNGIYYGTIHDAVKSVNIDGEPFIEVCPLNSVDAQNCFILNKEFLSCPPEQVLVTDLDGGYMLKFNGGYTVNEFKIISQQKYADAVVTAFSENGYKLSIETQTDFFAENLKMQVNSVEIVKKESLIVTYIYGQETMLNIYYLSGGIKKVFSKFIDGAEFNGVLKTTEILSDMAKHEVQTEWEFTGGEFRVKSRNVQSQNPLNLEKINVKLLPYAFLEEFLCGGHFIEYLSGNVKDNADKLGGYLGEFIGVMPPPVFKQIDQVGLVYSSGNNLYKVKYFKFEIQDRKIVNITC